MNNFRANHPEKYTKLSRNYVILYEKIKKPLRNKNKVHTYLFRILAKRLQFIHKADRARILSGTAPDRCKQKITNHCRRVKEPFQV